MFTRGMSLRFTRDRYINSPFIIRVHERLLPNEGSTNIAQRRHIENLVVIKRQRKKTNNTITVICDATEWIQQMSPHPIHQNRRELIEIEIEGYVFHSCRPAWRQSLDPFIHLAGVFLSFLTSSDQDFSSHVSRFFLARRELHGVYEICCLIVQLSVKHIMLCYAISHLAWGHESCGNMRCFPGVCHTLYLIEFNRSNPFLIWLWPCSDFTWKSSLHEMDNQGGIFSQ